MRAVGAIVLLFFLLDSPLWPLPEKVTQAPRPNPPAWNVIKPSSTTIDPRAFARSVHGGLDCTVCHTDGVSKFPHASNPAAMPDCIDCHAGTDVSGHRLRQDRIGSARRAFTSSMVDPAFRCTNCHSPHYFIPASQHDECGASRFWCSIKPCLGCHAAGDTAAATNAAFKRSRKSIGCFPIGSCTFSAMRASNATLRAANRRCISFFPSRRPFRNCATCHAKNSLMVTKLYTHLALKERAEHGWVNAMLFNNAYLTGATRNQWLDWGTFAMAGWSCFGAGGSRRRPVAIRPLQEEVMRRESGYPLWLRCWHWGNALLFVILLITGISMHYSKPGRRRLGSGPMS